MTLEDILYLLLCADGQRRPRDEFPGARWRLISAEYVYTCCWLLLDVKGPQPAQKGNGGKFTRFTYEAPSCSISAAFQLGRNQSDAMANQIYETERKKKQKKYKARPRRLASHCAKLCSEPRFPLWNASIGPDRWWIFFRFSLNKI
jgi:hypothetical protein